MHVDPVIIISNFAAFTLLIIERTYLQRKVKQLEATAQQMQEQIATQRRQIEEGTLAMHTTTQIIKALQRQF